MKPQNPRPPRRAVQGILLLDKPAGLSSNEALQRIKRLYQAEKAGHTGSLDPLATGLLPICFGNATKLSGQLLEADKRYRAGVRVGQRTSTGDAEGEVIARSDAALLDRAGLEAVLPRFLGTTRQVPPMYSALKHEGRRLYEIARAGGEVERESREIRVTELSLLAFEAGAFHLEVACSKGTYIRTLVEDIASAAGQHAHLIALRRTETGPFRASVQGMHDLDTLQSIASTGGGLSALDALLLPAASALAGWPRIEVDELRAQRLRQGLSQRVPAAPRDCALAVFGPAGALLCLAESDGEGVVAPRKWLAA